jgi:hypothetical protein
MPSVSSNAIGPFPGFYQVAYVTSDFDRALAQFGVTHRVGSFMELRGMHYATGPGREAICDVALAYVGATEIEVIHPISGDVQVYRDYLPRDGTFAVRFHHLSRLFETKEELEQELAGFRLQGRAVPVDGSAPGTARYFYADFRPELGHYVEGIYFEPEARAWLASIPRF